MKVRISKILAAGLVVLSLGGFAGMAHATTVTYTINGTIDRSYDIVAYNSLSNFFHYGDNYTLTAQFETGQPPNVHQSFTDSVSNKWYSDFSISMTINGETYTIGNSIKYGDHHDNDYRFAEASYVDVLYPDHVFVPHVRSDTIGMQDVDLTTSLGGSATSTRSDINYIYVNWYMTGQLGQTLLDEFNPVLPTTLNLSDWPLNHLSFQVISAVGPDCGTTNDNCYAAGDASFMTSISSHFTSVTTSGDLQNNVPAPGALALLGLGLFGIGGLRRKMKEIHP